MTTGDITEATFVLRATERKYNVFLPTTHHTKCDVVIKPPNSGLIGVQIKKASRQKRSNGEYGDSWKFMVGSGKPVGQRKPDTKRYTLYQEGDFDVMAAYIQEHDTWVFYRLDELVGKPSRRWSKQRSRRNNWDIFENFSVEKSLQAGKKT